MAEIEKEYNIARPKSSRVFLFGLEEKAAVPDLKGHLLFFSVSGLGLALDLWSKWAVFEWLKDKPGNSFSVIDGFLQLVMAVNDGAAFGIGSGKRFALTAVSITALVVVFIYFLFFCGKERKSMYLILALFTGGICGNLYDRIFNEGLVRDFIDVVYWPGKHWPAFNVADSLLCIAVGLLIILSVTGKSGQGRGQKQK